MYEVVKVPPFTGRPFLRLTPGLHHQTNMKKITKQQIIFGKIQTQHVLYQFITHILIPHHNHRGILIPQERIIYTLIFLKSKQLKKIHQTNPPEETKRIKEYGELQVSATARTFCHADSR